METADLDRAFDEGESVLEHLDLDRACRPNLEARRVNVEFPAWMVEGLDARATHLGIRGRLGSICGFRNGWSDG